MVHCSEAVFAHPFFLVLFSEGTTVPHRAETLRKDRISGGESRYSRGSLFNHEKRRVFYEQV